MTLDEIWKTYEGYSKSASDAARPLAFAGIAVIWLFKVDLNGSVHLERPLILAGFLFALALAFDLLQFIFGTVVFLCLGTSREKLSGKARDADYSHWMTVPIDLWFGLKLIAIVVGYGFLLGQLLTKLA